MTGPNFRIRTAAPAQNTQTTGAITPRGIQPVGSSLSPSSNLSGQTRTPRPSAGVTGYANVREQQAREAADAARRAQERAEGYMPPDFFLKSPQSRGARPDELQANIVILDHEPAFAIHEHSFPDPKTGRFGKGAFRTICLAGEGPCPGCEVDQNEAYYALKLTVIDMRPYTNRNGQVIPFSRKLLTVKQRNQAYFFRQFEQRGTLRGTQLLMIRDDQRGASHGNPEFIDIHSEEVIISSFQHPQVMSQDGKRVVKEANADCYPYDYAQLFPRLTYEELAAKVGATHSMDRGFSPGLVGNSVWGSDYGQFQGIRTQGGGMAAASGIIRPAGAAANRMVGDQHDYRDGGAGELDDDVPFEPEESAPRTGAISPIRAANTGLTRGQNTGHQEGALSASEIPL